MADRGLDRLVWIDCEMTGLDLRRDALIEIAALVTDAELNVLDEGLDIVITADDVARRDAAESSATCTPLRADRGGPRRRRRRSPRPSSGARLRPRSTSRSARTAPLCGNSIATDRGFLARDMPQLDAHLHYRMVDVSSIKELARRWYPRVYFAPSREGLAHRALADIMESIRELRYYRARCSCRRPGRTRTEQGGGRAARSAAAEHRLGRLD